MNYACIFDFGGNHKSAIDNPWTYCASTQLDNNFWHGGNASDLNMFTKKCSAFTSQYCAVDDGYDINCEIASRNVNKVYPNDLQSACTPPEILQHYPSLNRGDVFLRNTMAERYLVKMNGAHREYHPFDPNVANSPLISYWVGNIGDITGIICANGAPSPCTLMRPIYAVNPANDLGFNYKNIDNDRLMNRVLENPSIAIDIFTNIYETMKKRGDLNKLSNTKLGNFFHNSPYFKK